MHPETKNIYTANIWYNTFCISDFSKFTEVKGLRLFIFFIKDFFLKRIILFKIRNKKFF